MQRQMTVSKHLSIGFGLATLMVALYCLQYALLSNPIVMPFLYAVALGSLLVVVTGNFYEDIEFSGFGLVPPRRIVVALFWLSIVFICVAFALHSVASDVKSAPGRNSHFIVGILLYCYGVSALLGSYFSGLGWYLFLKSPFLWAKYVTMRAHGDSRGAKSNIPDRTSKK